MVRPLLVVTVAFPPLAKAATPELKKVPLPLTLITPPEAPVMFTVATLPEPEPCVSATMP